MIHIEQVLRVCGLDIAKKVALWGTYGKESKGPLQWVLLHERDTDHLQAILRTQPPHLLGYALITIIHSILEDRGVAPQAYNTKASYSWALEVATNPESAKELVDGWQPTDEQIDRIDKFR